MKKLRIDRIKNRGLRWKEEGFSYRDIATSIGFSKSLVVETIRISGITNIRNRIEYTEAELEAFLYPEEKKDVDSKVPDMMYILVELSRKHVTRLFLLEKYKCEHP